MFITCNSESDIRLTYHIMKKIFILSVSEKLHFLRDTKWLTGGSAWIRN